MTCGGGHLGFQINTKNTNLINANNPVIILRFAILTPERLSR